jgi:SAM-dependent methyltransferase
MNGSQLFDAFAHRYDLHTPAHHYQHDHQMVIDLARSTRALRILDVGCGTGVVLHRLQVAGFDAHGIDLAPGMVAEARKKVGDAQVRHLAMEALDDVAAFDLIVSLSWCVHYCADGGAMVEVLRRMARALRPSGQILLQVANGPNLPTDPQTDHEDGPTGIPNDVQFGYHFAMEDEQTLRATYTYTCASLHESFREEHRLRVATLPAMLHAVAAAGLQVQAVWGSWRLDPADDAGSPFLLLTAPPVTG